MEGITNEMANYITMALDPNAGNLYKLMNNQIGNYENKMEILQSELEQILLVRNLTIVDLFHKIAVR